MKVEYRGHELSANREMALGGWENLYYYVMRLSDFYFVFDGFTEGSDEIEDFIGYMKEWVDGYIKNPEDYADELTDLEHEREMVKGL